MIFKRSRLHARVTALENAEQCRQGNHKWVLKFIGDCLTRDAFSLLWAFRSKVPVISCDHCGTLYEQPSKPKPSRRN